MKKLLFLVSILLITISNTKENDLLKEDYSKFIKGDSIASKVEFFPVEIFAKSTTSWNNKKYLTWMMDK